MSMIAQAVEAAAEAIFDRDVNAVAHFSECSPIQRDFYLGAAGSALQAVGYAALLEVVEALRH